MFTSSSEFSPINVQLPGVNTAINHFPVESSTSPSSVVPDDDQLMRTIHYTHDGKSITFEIVNKRMSLMELDPSIEEPDPISNGFFTRISKAIFSSCVSFKHDA